jgi:predicted GH43/DUF377 family glycosyl hydrolase
MNSRDRSTRAAASGDDGYKNALYPSHVDCTRHGVILAPDGTDIEVEGVLNPGVTRDRSGGLILYPRKVAAGNVSRIGVVRCNGGLPNTIYERLDVILAPETEYEIRDQPGGFGCEDARVTFVPLLDKYVMAYTAFGIRGPRIAIAVSEDGYRWSRIGLVHFAGTELNALDNKDAAFFPEPVLSPNEVLSFAMYHRPMLPFSVNGQVPVSTIRSLDPGDRESTCIAYVPVDNVLLDLQNLRFPQESIKVLHVGPEWGSLKNGAGTPPVRTEAGWLSIFHAVDAFGPDENFSRKYSAGIVIHDLERPHRILYRSLRPLLEPETELERFGVVDDVVFPTGIDPLGDDQYDVYYGAADTRIARARVTIRF